MPGSRILVLLLGLGVLAPAHRLDEYLQATLISIAQDRVVLELELTPGVAVWPAVLAGIDTDGDGAISAAEQSAYAAAVVRDLSLEVDGQPVKLDLSGAEFAGPDEMREGLGRIRLRLAGAVKGAAVKGAARARHLLRYRNRHQPKISAWLVNCLAPEAGGLTILRQDRDYLQAGIDVGYSFAAVPLGLPWPGWWWALPVVAFVMARVAWIKYRAR